MSLLKQLLISVSLAIVIILGGALWLSVDSARNYLDTQLQVQTDSAATSLALTLSQASNQDPVTQELIIMALFDSGQFNRITLRDSHQQVVFLRQTEGGDSQGKAPSWFVRWLPIHAAEGAAQVSDGWRQVGQISLQADPTYARDSLWQSFVRLVAWVVGAGFLWALFVLFLIRWLRRVLHKEVTQQLHALTHDHEPTEKTYKKPTFTELNEVSQALATARQSIVATTEEQNAKLESLEIELNQDAVTGLVNRKYFINELRRQLEKNHGYGGWLFLFRQRDLAEINRVMARGNVDDWLRSLSQQLQQEIAQYNGTAQLTLARLNGSDFVLLINGLETEPMHKLMETVQLILRQQRIQLPNGTYCRWAMAQTDYKPGQFLVHIMGRLDQALMRAESAGHNVIEILTSEQAEQLIEQPKGGETQWRALIQDALEKQGLSLKLSPKRMGQHNWLEAVLALSLSHTDEKLLGYQFMPVATRLGLSAVCDLRAFELALNHLTQHENDRILLRVSLSSIAQDFFTDQVAQQLAQVEPSVAKRLAVELDAYALSSEPVRVARFTALLAEYGVLRGARRALQLPRVLMDLTTLHISYVRAENAELLELEQKTGGLIVLRSALDICALSGVLFIFDGEFSQLTESTRQMLQEYGKLTSSST